MDVLDAFAKYDENVENHELRFENPFPCRWHVHIGTAHCGTSSYQKRKAS